jgi:hypothetical protein
MPDVSPQCAAKQILATGADQVARPRSHAGWSRAVSVGRSWQRAFCGGYPCVPLSRASSRIFAPLRSQIHRSGLPHSDVPRSTVPLCMLTGFWTARCGGSWSDKFREQLCRALEAGWDATEPLSASNQYGPTKKLQTIRPNLRRPRSTARRPRLHAHTPQTTLVKW